MEEKPEPSQYCVPSLVRSVIECLVMCCDPEAAGSSSPHPRPMSPRGEPLPEALGGFSHRSARPGVGLEKESSIFRYWQVHGGGRHQLGSGATSWRRLAGRFLWPVHLGPTRNAQFEQFFSMPAIWFAGANP